MESSMWERIVMALLKDAPTALLMMAMSALVNMDLYQIVQRFAEMVWKLSLNSAMMETISAMTAAAISAKMNSVVMESDNQTNNVMTTTQPTGMDAQENVKLSVEMKL